MTLNPIEEDKRRVLAIVEKLLEQTRNGNLSWLSLGQSAYGYSSSSSTVIVASKDDDDNYPFLVSITNRSGAVVSSLMVRDDTEPMGSEVAELYRLAGRAHLRVDETLDGLLADLNNEPPF